MRSDLFAGQLLKDFVHSRKDSNRSAVLFVEMIVFLEDGYPLEMQELYNLVRGVASSFAPSFSTLAGIASLPVALLVLSVIMAIAMS